MPGHDPECGQFARRARGAAWEVLANKREEITESTRRHRRWVVVEDSRLGRYVLRGISGLD